MAIASGRVPYGILLPGILGYYLLHSTSFSSRLRGEDKGADATWPTSRRDDDRRVARLYSRRYPVKSIGNPVSWAARA